MRLGGEVFEGEDGALIGPGCILRPNLSETSRCDFVLEQYLHPQLLVFIVESLKSHRACGKNSFAERNFVTVLDPDDLCHYAK